MNKQEINQYLVETAFEECWHELAEITDQSSMTKVCVKCGTPAPRGWFPFKRRNSFTNEGCMGLWLKIQEMEWFYEFIYCQPFALLEGYHPVFGLAELIHPDRLAPAVYEFLKKRNIYE